MRQGDETKTWIEAVNDLVAENTNDDIKQRACEIVRNAWDQQYALDDIIAKIMSL